MERVVRVLMVATALLPSFRVMSAAAEDRIRVRKQDELPRHTYPVEGSASDILRSREALLRLGAAVRTDIETTLARYEIEDRSTLQSLYATLQNIALIEGDDSRALDYLERIRSLEDKESKRLTQGLMLRSYFSARRATGKTPADEAFRASFREDLRTQISVLPWNVVEDNLEQLKGNVELLSDGLLYGTVAATIDPSVAKSGFLSGEQASQLLNIGPTFDLVLPLKDDVVAVLDDAISANRTEKEDIWPARTLVLDHGNPVIVGIWDTGMDVTVFKGRMDDEKGIAFDRNHDLTTHLLYPLGDAAGRRDELAGSFKGLFDLQAALNTPESTELKQRLAALPPDDVAAFLEDLTLYTHHAHGTHVAGIAIEGNPYALIVPARLGTDHRLIPDPPTGEQARKMALEFRATVDYFKERGARVVNMSWAITAQGFEDDFEKNGIGKDQEERARMARELFAVCREGLYKALESAPGILFVGAAGNSDNDVNFDEFIPPAFELPNLVIAGAVDQSGEATNFTSFGRGVDVYSNGFEVDSFVPGGGRMKLSGTSMASPNVVNLAAKLLSLDPALTPPQVIDLIRQGAEPRGPEKKLLVIDPKKSAELLTRRPSP